MSLLQESAPRERREQLRVELWAARALGAAGLFSCVGFVLLAGKLARGAWSWAAAPEVDSELVARLAKPCRVSRVGNCA